MRRFISQRAVTVRGSIVALLLSATAVCLGQAAGGGAAKEADSGVGNYSIVVTIVEPSSATHLLNPAPTVMVDHASRQEPKDSVGELDVAPEMAIEGLAKPRFVCIPAMPRDRGCEAIDLCGLTVRDANKLEYHVINHGAAAQLKVNLLVHDLLPVSREGAKTVWHAGDVIFVSASKATQTMRVVSTVLVGEWNHQPIVFEVGKPLTGNAAIALEDLSVKQDLGDRVLYSFKVKAAPK